MHNLPWEFKKEKSPSHWESGSLQREAEGGYKHRWTEGRACLDGTAGAKPADNEDELFHILFSFRSLPIS